MQKYQKHFACRNLPAAAWSSALVDLFCSSHSKGRLQRSSSSDTSTPVVQSFEWQQERHSGVSAYLAISAQAAFVILQSKCPCAHQSQNEHTHFQPYGLNCQCFTYICVEWIEAGVDENYLHFDFNYDSVRW